MSRTFRRKREYGVRVNGEDMSWVEEREFLRRHPEMEEESVGWKGRTKISEGRDKKPGENPPKQFKKINRRQERAQANNAMRQDKEPPRVRKSDRWEWI